MAASWLSCVTRGRCGGLVTRACKPCYHVISLLYTSKTYSGVIPSFLFTFCVTIHYVSVCFIIYNINKSQSFFYISYLFMFFKCYITISYSLYYIYQTTDPCPVWGYLFNSGLYPTTVTTLKMWKDIFYIKAVRKYRYFFKRSS